jgi:small nuclear ribonucleoprotein (snRNP)-like protein
MQNTIPAARRKDTLCKFFRAIPGARVTIETTNNDSFTGDITNVDLNFKFVKNYIS